jgi:PQQ system protein
VTRSGSRESTAHSPRLARHALLPVVLFSVLSLTACDYLRLFRPSVLRQLRPPMVRLVDFLPEVDQQNKAIVGRLVATGGLSEASSDARGVMHSAIRIRKDELIYEPSIVVMPNGGELDLTITNEDEAVHVLYLPSNGQRQVLVLLQHRAGTAQLRLDAPGLYTIACPVGNHAGRGELGLIIVRGDTPASGRLDRPAQPRPGR